MIKAILKFIVYSALLVPFLVSANVIEEQAVSNFSSIGTIESNSFSVPTVIDVPINFNPRMVDQHVVVDSSLNMIPSIIVTQTSKEDVQLSVSPIIGVSNIGNIVDTNRSTYAEFAYTEQYDEKGIIQENTVTIDVLGNRSFVADSFTISLGEHIERPKHVRVTTIAKDGTETILLPQQWVTSDRVTFPTQTSDHLRITFGYTKPLRITEIVFYEKNIPYTIEKSIRFIAQPEETYNIYYDAVKRVILDVGEMPNLNSVPDKVIVPLDSVSANESYRKSDTDEDGIADDIDNCLHIVNPSQEDIDKNKIGDACEDFDRDGVINSKDNCINNPNRFQADVDGDGVGDICDEEESRITEKYVWLPWVGMGLAGLIVLGLFFVTLRGMRKEDEMKEQSEEISGDTPDSDNEQIVP